MSLIIIKCNYLFSSSGSSYWLYLVSVPAQISRSGGESYCILLHFEIQARYVAHFEKKEPLPICVVRTLEDPKVSLHTVIFWHCSHFSNSLWNMVVQRPGSSIGQSTIGAMRGLQLGQIRIDSSGCDVFQIGGPLRWQWCLPDWCPPSHAWQAPLNSSLRYYIKPTLCSRIIWIWESLAGITVLAL